MQILIELLLDKKKRKTGPMGYETLLVVKPNKATES